MPRTFKHRKPPTAEQQRKAQEKRDRFKAIVKKLGDMTDEERNAFASNCPVIANTEGHVLSPSNTMLVIMQCPNATVVGGFGQWIQQKRVVKKNESGIVIWAPGQTPKDESGDS